MGRKCSAVMCGKTVEDGVKLFQFPEKYSHNWIFAVDRGAAWIPDINSRLCSDHFPQEAFFGSDKLGAMKVGSEPNPGEATSISEEDKLMLVSKIRADNLRQEELEAKNKMNEVMSRENPELWEVVLMLRRTEVDVQEFATEVVSTQSRFGESDPQTLDLEHPELSQPLGDKKILVEKIINDIKTTQRKVEGYILKARKEEVDFGLKLPKLEPVGEEENGEEDHKRGIRDALYKMKKEDHADSKEKPRFEIDPTLYCESVLEMAVALDEAKFLKEIGSGLNSLDYVNDEENSNHGNYYDTYAYDFDKEASCKKEPKPRTRKPRNRRKANTQNMKMRCKLCETEEIFASSTTLIKHVTQEHGEPPYQCIQCPEKKDTYLKLSSHVKRIHRQLLIDCTVCNKKIKEFNMYRHMRVHSGERPHSCDVCGKSFTLGAQLRIHMRVHTGDRPYKCKLCSHSYKQGAHLRHHVRSVHQGMTPHQTTKVMTAEEKEAKKRVCGICGKVLANYLSYKIHERIHTGIKPYSCDICNKTFASISGRNNHKDSHNETKDYSCETCGMSFRMKCKLALHRRTHDKSLEKSLTCELCGLKFTLACNMKRHIAVTHNKIKLHSCDVCERSFGSKSEVRQHMRVHTGEKPFQCDICSKSFTQSSSLYSHNKKNHDYEPKNEQIPLNYIDEKKF